MSAEPASPFAIKTRGRKASFLASSVASPLLKVKDALNMKNKMYDIVANDETVLYSGYIDKVLLSASGQVETKNTRIMMLTSLQLVLLHPSTFDVDEQIKLEQIKSVFWDAQRTSDGFIAIEASTANSLVPASNTTTTTSSNNTGMKLIVTYWPNKFEFFESMQYAFRAIQQHMYSRRFSEVDEASTQSEDTLSFENADFMKHVPSVIPFVQKKYFTKKSSGYKATLDEDETGIPEHDNSNPFLINVVDERLYDFPVANDAHILQWLVHFEDVGLHCSQVCQVRLPNQKWQRVVFFMTETAIYLCNFDTLKMERRILLSLLGGMIVEHKSAVHEEFALLVPTECDVYIKMEITDKFITMIRKMLKNLQVSYEQNIINKLQLTPSEAYQTRLNQISDKGYIADGLMQAITNSNDADIRQCLQWARDVGMHDDPLVLLALDELKILTEAQKLKELMLTAISDCEVDEIERLMALAKKKSMDKLYNEMKPQAEFMSNTNKIVIDVCACIRTSQSDNIRDSKKMQLQQKVHAYMEQLNKSITKEQAILFFTASIKRSYESFDPDTIQDLLICAGLLNQSLEQENEILTVIKPKANAYIKQIEADMQKKELLIKPSEAVSMNKEEYALEVRLRPLCWEKYAPFQAFSIRVDVYDKLGYHHTGFEFFCNNNIKLWTLNNNSKRQDMIIRIPTSQLEVKPELIKSQQVHFVFSIEFGDTIMGNIKPHIVCTRVITVPKKKGISPVQTSSSMKGEFVVATEVFRGLTRVESNKGYILCVLSRLAKQELIEEVALPRSNSTGKKTPSKTPIKKKPLKPGTGKYHTVIHWSALSVSKPIPSDTSVDKYRQYLGILPPPKGFVVAVLEGRDLASRDFNGKSDPYIVVEYEKQKHKTKVCKTTLTPLWENEVFELTLGKTPTKLHITCWDWDLTGGIKGHDFMGEFYIDLTTVENGLDMWYKLMPNDKYKEDGEVTGEIKLCIEFDFGEIDKL